MKERPIIFSGEMVKAILAGRKTQTRRVIKPQPLTFNDTGWPLERKAHFLYWSEGTTIFHNPLQCPYGVPGNHLWVRETWAQLNRADETGEIDIAHRADDWPDDEPSPDYKLERWRSPIYMPRWASRLTLEVVKVNVQRLQDISEEDAIKEGAPIKPPIGMGILALKSSIDGFSRLWNSINAKRGFGWHMNPYVWMIDFKVCD